jgi:hypothetical protein
MSQNQIYKKTHKNQVCPAKSKVSASGSINTWWCS